MAVSYFLIRTSLKLPEHVSHSFLFSLSPNPPAFLAFFLSIVFLFSVPSLFLELWGLFSWKSFYLKIKSCFNKTVGVIKRFSMHGNFSRGCPTSELDSFLPRDRTYSLHVCTTEYKVHRFCFKLRNISRWDFCVGSEWDFLISSMTWGLMTPEEGGIRRDLVVSWSREMEDFFLLYGFIDCSLHSFALSLYLNKVYLSKSNCSGTTVFIEDFY